MSSAQPPFTPTRPPPTDSESRVRISFPQAGPEKSNAGAVAQLTLCSPKNLNSVRSIDIQAIISLLDWIQEQPQIVVTMFTGEGRYLSAGADVADPARGVQPEETENFPASDQRHIAALRQWATGRVMANNGALARAFYKHDKLLVAACNGPVVGIMACILGFFDLIYTYDDFFLLTPFSSLALVCEAASSLTFAKKMGLGRAQQALIEGRRMPAKDLLDAGFISRIIETPPRPANADKHYTAPIAESVLEHIGGRLLPPTVDTFGMLYTKRILRDAAYEHMSFNDVNSEELVGAQHVFMSGRPKAQFARIASGGRHKM